MTSYKSRLIDLNNEFTNLITVETIKVASSLVIINLLT